MPLTLGSLEAEDEGRQAAIHAASVVPVAPAAAPAPSGSSSSLATSAGTSSASLPRRFLGFHSGSVGAPFGCLGGLGAPRAVTLGWTDPAGAAQGWARPAAPPLVVRASGLLAGRLGRSRLRIRYPRRFKVMFWLVVALAVLWLANYFVVLAPQAQGIASVRLQNIIYNARMLFVYFAWFACTRLALFIPCVALRALRVQARTHGFCHTYWVQLLLRDGPLYIFALGSVLFWFHLTQPLTGDDRQFSELFAAMRLFAIYSNVVSLCCLMLTYWHNKLLADAALELESLRGSRGAPSDTIHRLRTACYDAAVFGDEDGKMYPSECAICLGQWEAEDSIKVTPCGHAFHEDCLAGWLRTARTCALCRRDLPELAASASASLAGGDDPVIEEA